MNKIFFRAFIVTMLIAQLGCKNQNNKTPVLSPISYMDAQQGLHFDGNVPFSMPQVVLPTFKTDTFNIVKYGAIADGLTLNTQAIQAAHTGFNGEGLVDTYNKPGSYADVNTDSVSAGSYFLGIRYVQGKTDTRLAELQVNGKVINKLAFEPTSAWTAWTTKYTLVELKAGRNSIRLTATGNEGLTNIDHFAFIPFQYKS